MSVELSVTIENWLANTTREFGGSGIGTARLDALVLSESVLNKDRAWLLANPKTKLTTRELKELNFLFKRRMSHEPLAYILGKTEFYGRNFTITPAVLEPRPESETMIDCLKDIAQKMAKKSSSKPSYDFLSIADIGTGSGALGITAALELPKCSVDLIDIDKKALRVAKMNVDLFTLNINIIQHDLLANVTKDYDVLLCNLPYVPDDYQINRAALHEPKMAIFGGKDGLFVYRKLFDQITKRQKKPLYILTESLPFQHTTLANIASKSSYRLVNSDDFIQVFKSSLN